MVSGMRVQVGLIGHGLALSLSPSLHEAEGTHLGLDYRYQLFDSETDSRFEDVEFVLDTVLSEGYVGTNITHPFKQQVIAFLDSMDTTAQAIGAVNTVVLSDGKRIGHNTDWLGFLRSLEYNIPQDKLNRVVQIGAGGAGAAVTYALLHYGVQHLIIVDIDDVRSRELAERMGPQFPTKSLETGHPDQLDRVVSGADGVVNATPIGMSHQPGLPLPEHLISPERWFHDVVYMPLTTPLVSRALDVGATVAGGGDMVVFQAAEGIRLFTGLEPDSERMRNHFFDLVRSGAQSKQARTPDSR